MASDRVGNISLDIAAVAILHNAAAKLATINRAKNQLKNVKTEDDVLQATLDYVAEKIKERIGA